MSASKETFQPHQVPNTLHSQLHRIAVLHELEAPHTRQSSGKKYIDMMRQNQAAYDTHHLQRATDTSMEFSQFAGASLEKQRTLEAIQLTLVKESVQTTSPENEQIDWNATVDKLYNLSTKASGSERDSLLVSTVIASQFSPDANTRFNLLQQVYADERENEVATACEQSHIMLVHEEVDDREEVTPLLSISGMGAIFRTPAKHMQRYLDIVSRKDQSELPAKKARRELAASTSSGEHDYATDQPQAEEASLNDKLAGGWLVDRHKVERFALQEKFLHDQEKAVLGEGNLHESPLTQELARRHLNGNTVINRGDFSRRGTPTSDFTILQADVQQALAELSKPIIDRYSLNGIDTSSYEGLTEDQAANLRFQRITAETAGDIRIAHFIDFDHAQQRLSETNLEFFNQESGRNIWDVSKEGSSLPAALVAMIKKTVNASQRSEADPKAEELRDLLYAKRRDLLFLAAQNIESDTPQAAIRLSFGKVEIIRNSQSGVLEYEGALISPGKTNFDMLAAATLGCPALRILHSGVSAEAVKKLTAGNGVYFDHLATVIIDEAYNRGMFKPGWYDAPDDPWL